MGRICGDWVGDPHCRAEKSTPLNCLWMKSHIIDIAQVMDSGGKAGLVGREVGG